ncbi:MAG: hypothetical protein HeimC2_42310 [Candidatus Heimdallarchaeota archaeon LC_2]|nr:MAG: hypothetical protein HeimC2_42310 [Candidatus Heimdallarchaeota archaeon LC_2]
MPVLNKYRVIHFGVKTKANQSVVYFKDLTIPFYGKNTYIYGTNGTGKSSLISLLLYSLHPLKRDFPKGEGKKRVFTDYVMGDRPGYIMLEWILNPNEVDESKRRFLLTGMVVSTRQQKLREQFFLREYDASTATITLDNFSPIEEGLPQSLEAVRTLLRNNKFRLTTGANEWMDMLENFMIHRSMISNLIKLNQTENSMKEGLQYDSELEFVVSLLKDIVPEPAESESFGIQLKNQFSFIKKQPDIKRELQFLKETGEKIKPYVSLNDIKNKLITEYERINAEVRHNQFTSVKVSKILEKDLVNVDMELTEKKEKVKHLKEQKEQIALNLKIAEFLYKTSYLDILSLDKVSKEVKIDRLMKNQNLVGFIEKYFELHKLKGDLDVSEEQLSINSKMLKEKISKSLSKMKTILVGLYLQEKPKYLDNLNSIDQLEKQISANDQEIGRNEEREKNLTIRVKEIKKEINKIKDLESYYTESCGSWNDLEELKDSILKKYNNHSEKLTSLREKNLMFEGLINNIGIKIENEKHRLEKLRQNQNKFKTELKEYDEIWQRVVDHRITNTDLGTLDPNITDIEVISVDYINEKKNQMMKLQLRSAENQILSNKDDFILSHWDSVGKLKPDSKIMDTCEYLQNQGYQVTDAWTYLQTYPSFIPIAEKYPILFTGIAVISPNSIIQIRELLETRYKDEYFDVPLLILDVELLENDLDSAVWEIPNLLTTSPLSGIDWKFSKEKLNLYIEHLRMKQEEYKIVQQDIEKDIQLIIDYLDLCNSLPSSNKYEVLQAESKNVDDDIKSTQDHTNTLEKEAGDTEKQIELLKLQIRDTEEQFRVWAKIKDHFLTNSSLLENKITIIEKHEKMKFQISDAREIIISIKYENKMNGSELESTKKIVELHKRTLEDYEEQANEYLNVEIFELLKNIDPPKKTQHLQSYNQYKDAMQQYKRQLDEDPSLEELKKRRDEIKNKFKSQLSNLKKNLAVVNCTIEQLEGLYRQHKQELDHVSTIMTFRQNLQKGLVKIRSEFEKLSEEYSDVNILVKSLRIELLTNLPKIDSEVPIEKLHKEFHNKIKENETNEELLEHSKSDLEAVEKRQQTLNFQVQKIDGYLRELESQIVTLELVLSQINIKNVQIQSFQPSSLTSIQNDLRLIIENIEDKLDINQTTIRTLKDNVDKFNEHLSDFKKFRMTQSEKVGNDVYLSSIAICLDLEVLEIQYIEEYERELENRATEQELILSSHTEKLESTISLFDMQLQDILRKINRFQSKRIPFMKGDVVESIQPLMMEFTFRWKDISNETSIFLRQYFQSLQTHDEFPDHLRNYLNLYSEILNQFLSTRLKVVKIRRPNGSGGYDIHDMDFALKGSGGEGATLSIILYCLTAYYQAFYEIGQDNVDLPKITDQISLPFINDNATGQVNRPDLVKMQLDLAASLNIQIIIFSPISDDGVIDEFEQFFKLKKSNEKYVIGEEVDRVTIGTVEGGPEFYHTPIRQTGGD